MLDVAAALSAGREAAESRMNSRATVRRKTGGTTTVNRMEVPAWDDVHTDLPFRLDDAGARSIGKSRSVTIGGVTFEQAMGVGHMPASTVDLADNDLIEVTAGEWAGEVYRIVEAVKGDQRTARRVPIIAVERPEEWV